MLFLKAIKKTFLFFFNFTDKFEKEKKKERKLYLVSEDHSLFYFFSSWLLLLIITCFDFKAMLIFFVLSLLKMYHHPHLLPDNIRTNVYFIPEILVMYLSGKLVLFCWALLQIASFMMRGERRTITREYVIIKMLQSLWHRNSCHEGTHG